MAGAVRHCQEQHSRRRKSASFFAVSNDHLMALRRRAGAVQQIISRHRTLQPKLSEIRANEAREKAAKPSASAA
jgi:hypothetical protein